MALPNQQTIDYSSFRLELLAMVALGRAREAGEINKSLLTLVRVINALVEHLGHIPYRDDKLTRLLRDSLGEEQRPVLLLQYHQLYHFLHPVNQRLMKSTVIKDVYGEIERLKAG